VAGGDVSGDPPASPCGSNILLGDIGSVNHNSYTYVHSYSLPSFYSTSFISYGLMDSYTVHKDKKVKYSK
jgi:hypothetical protein